MIITKKEMRVASKTYHQLEIAYKEFIGRYFSAFGRAAKPVNEEEFKKIRVFRSEVELAKINLKDTRALYYSIN